MFGDNLVTIMTSLTLLSDTDQTPLALQDPHLQRILTVACPEGIILRTERGWLGCWRGRRALERLEGLISILLAEDIIGLLGRLLPEIGIAGCVGTQAAGLDTCSKIRGGLIEKLELLLGE